MQIFYLKSTFEDFLFNYIGVQMKSYPKVII
jgi:hypothetical protein